MDITVGCGEELAVALEECAPTVLVPRDLVLQAVVALADDLHLRSLDVQQMVRALKTLLD